MTIKKVGYYPNEPHQDQWRSCYLGISLNNSRVSNEESLNEILAWFKERTDSITILVGDYVERLNRMIYDGLSEEVAMKLCIQTGKERAAMITNASSKIALEVKTRYASSFVKDQGFEERLTEFWEIYRTNEKLHFAIDHALNDFTDRSSKPVISLKKTKQLSVQYFLEELVMFESLSSEGLKLLVYPGNTPVVKNFVVGGLPGISPLLEDITIGKILFKPKT